MPAMPMRNARPAIETVELNYVDYLSGQARGEPTAEECVKVAGRLLTAAARQVLGRDVKLVQCDISDDVCPVSRQEGHR